MIQEHHARRLHWDFRLERDGVLVSWALPKGVPNDPAVNHLAVHTEDHPLEYGRFEGEIPRGEYGAGAVTIWDHGSYETLKWAPSEVKVVLHGQRVTGGYVLFQTKGNQWMIHRERLALPGALRPMLAVTGPMPRDPDNWALEMKWDGVRALAYIERGKVRLMSRSERDITVTYPELSRLGAATLLKPAATPDGPAPTPAPHKQLLLDGEIVVFGADGWPEFEALQPRMHVGSAAQAALLAGQTPVTYLIFDVLQLDGRPLMDLEYHERRALLDELALAGPYWQTPPWFPGSDFAAVQAVSVSHGMEGVVAKRLDSRYTPGVRTDNWRKIKNVHTQEAVVAGVQAGQRQPHRAGRVPAHRGERRLRPGLCRSRRDRLHRRDAAHAGGQAAPAAPPRLPVRQPRPRPSTPAPRSGSNRAWSSRSPSTAGPRPAACAPRSTRACATTSIPRTWSASEPKRAASPGLRSEATKEGDAFRRAEANGKQSEPKRAASPGLRSEATKEGDAFRRAEANGKQSEPKRAASPGLRSEATKEGDAFRRAEANGKQSEPKRAASPGLRSEATKEGDAFRRAEANGKQSEP